MTQEEIIVKLGVDSTGFKKGLNEADDFAQEWGGHIIKKLQKLFLYHEAISMIKEFIKESFATITEEIFNHIYNYTDFQAQWFERARKNMHQWREELAKENKAEEDRSKKQAESNERLEEFTRKLRDLREQNALAEKGWMSDSDKGRQLHITQLKREEVRLAEVIADYQTDEEERAKAQVALETAKAARLAEQEKLREKALAQQQSITEMLKEQHKLIDLKAAKGELEAYKKDREREEELRPFMPSIHEFATTPWSPWQRSARQIELWEQSARIDFLRGKAGFAREDIEERNKIYDRFADAGLAPQRREVVDKAIKDMSDNIAQISEGKKIVLVKAQNGK